MYEGSASGTLFQQVHILFTAGTAVGLTDRDLLERFLHEGHESGEAAFNALVERHGPMVFRVCNQALRDRHAAEDAFQATFLVLARQAQSIRRHDSVPSWLFGVACRAAARIRMLEARRQQYERRSATARAHRHSDASDSSQPWPELHAEIARLPEKYRVPIVLCYFEGLTHEQAAGRLGWPVGTVKTRLARAREQLRVRLKRHGWNSALLIPTEHLRPLDIPEVSRLLLDATTRAAAKFISSSGRFIPSTVLAITQGVLKDMLIMQLKLAAITVFGVAALGLGAMVLARQSPREPQADGQPKPVSTPATDSPRPSVLSLPGRTSYDTKSLIRIHPPYDSSLVNKVVVNLGEVVNPGDPLLELVSTELTEAKTGKSEGGDRKAKMAVRSPMGGVVIRRDVVPGNFYDAQDTLLIIAQNDRMRVYAGIDSRQAHKLELGQRVTVTFPYMDRTENATVEGISQEGSRATGTVTFWTSIPNPDHQLKADMLVRVGVDPTPKLRSTSAARAPAPRKSNQTLDERLNEVERKLDLLLGEKARQSPDTKVLERLNELERKLDRALNVRPPQ